MSNKAVIVPEGIFRSKLIPVITVLCLAAAVCGLASAAGLLIPGGVVALVPSPYLGSITVRRYLTTWRVLHTGFILAGLFCAAVMGVSLTLAGRKKIDRGAELIVRSTRWLLTFVNGSGIVAAAVFVYFAIRYATWVFDPALNPGVDITYGLFPLFSSLLLEGIMAAQAVFIFRKLRQFLSDLGDTAASISRTITTGILRAPTIPALTSVGFLILGLVNFYLVYDRIAVLSRVVSLSAAASAGTFLLGGIADILLFSYLRSYKLKEEYLLYKGAPAEAENH